MSKEARFDPRFDPAFQPGYDESLASAQPATKRRPTATAPAPIGQPPAWSQYAPTTRSAPAAAPIDAPPAATEVLSTPADLDDDPAPRRANPFLIALGAVAILLLGGGLYLVSRMRDLFADTQSSSTFDYVTIQVLMFAAPLILVLGLATGVGLLFVFAIRWDRR